MRRMKLVGRAWPSPVVGLIAGIAVSIMAVLIESGALAQRSPDVPGAIFEATHVPPLLALPGEPVSLAYDVHCSAEGVDDPEAGCQVTGSVFLRADRRDEFTRLRLREVESSGVRQLAALVPEPFAARDGFEYYAEFEGHGAGDVLVVPPGGAGAPHRTHVLRSPVEIDLGATSFGRTRRGARVVSARWGDGSTDVGLEAGRNLGAIGASSFDVDETGTVSLLDQVHRRVLRWARGAHRPARVPISVDGRLADMTVADDGSLYVLESVTAPGHGPLVRRFDGTGRELDLVETAEQSPSQIRVGPDGPVVLQHPSHQWTPIARGGSPVGPDEQRRRGTVGKPLRAGGEVIVYRTGDELRIAVVSHDRVARSWRLISETPLGEAQLAEPLGQRLVVVVRIYTDDADEFRVVVLDREGIARQFSVASSDWAETAPLSRFRVAGDSLYQLGSNATGAFVDRYDLEVR